MQLLLLLHAATTCVLLLFMHASISSIATITTATATATATIYAACYATTKLCNHYLNKWRYYSSLASDQ
jgi:hypothetical protein